MNLNELVGEKVKHKKFGEGTVTSVEGDTAVIDFNGDERKLSIKMAFNQSKFVSILNSNLQQDLDNHLASLEEEEAKRKQLEKEMVAKAEEEKREAQRQRAAERRARSKSDGQTVWIKFEGAQNRNAYANLHKIIQNGKEWYVLHYKRKPANVKDGDSFFMAEGIEDNMGRPRQVITGRGHLCGFSEDNYSPEEWTKFYSWIPAHPWYVVIKDFEMLDTQISNDLMLEQVIKDVGTETFEASSGMDRDYDYLMHIHTQKQHMKLTKEAEDYINEKFDELAKQYGSKKYYTEF